MYKTGLTFERAFYMGVLANWLVCMAVWLAMAAKDIAGKILAIFSQYGYLLLLDLNTA